MDWTPSLLNPIAEESIGSWAVLVEGIAGRIEVKSNPSGFGRIGRREMGMTTTARVLVTAHGVDRTDGVSCCDHHGCLPPSRFRQSLPKRSTLPATFLLRHAARVPRLSRRFCRVTLQA